MPNNQSVCQQQQQPQQSTGGCAVGAASDGSSIQQHQPQSSQQLITSASTATTNTNNNTNNSHDNNNNNNNSVTTTTTTNNNNNNSNPTATTTTTTTGSSSNNNNNNKTVAAGSDYLRPCVALSQRIMPVYRHINSVYSEERRRRQPGPKYNDGYDDRHGHYLVFTGEIIWGRYTVQGVLGRGSFGTVLKCFDEKHQEQVAAKVIRNGEYFYSQGLMEVDIVARLNSIPPLENLVVRLGKVFLWKGHLVLVFEMLSMNLFQLIQRTNYNGVSLDLTRKFAYQLILVLKQLEEHDPPIIHCDVKPENVVLRDPSRSSIRLIDFGSACYLHQGAKLYKYVQSRFYRSVEVILELGYDTAIDRWSLGCMLVELHTGVPLFAGKNEADQLARFVAVLGPVPDEMIGRSPKKDVFFVDCRRAQQQGGSPAMTDHHHNNNNHNQQQQKRGHAASPSPVIEAEVLHSLSATSSISVLTAESAATMWPYAPQADAAGTAVAAPPPPQQQQQHVGGAETTGGVGAAEGRQMYGNSSSAAGNNTYVNNNTNTNNNNNNNNNATNSNNAVTAVPALHRPRTAFTTTSSSARKENNAGYTTVSSGGGFFTPNVARKGSKYSTSGNHQIQPKSFLSTNTTASASASAPMPMTTLQARSSAQLRYSVFTPRSRLPSSSSNNHPAPHDDGSSSSLPTSATGRRVNMQQTTSAPGETRETSSPPLKSPFALRFPLASEQYQSLEDIIGVYSGGPRGCRQRQAGHGVDDYKVFLDFVQRLLCYDPRKRMTCTEALQHPFLSELEMQKQWRYLSGGGAS